MDRPAGSHGSYCPAPRDLMFLSQWLKNKGHDTKMMDACAMSYTEYEQMFADIDKLNPEKIIIDITTPQADISMEVARKLSEKYEIILVGSFMYLLHEKGIVIDWAHTISGGYEYGMDEYFRTGNPDVVGAKMINRADFQDLELDFEQAIQCGPYSSPFLWREPALKHKYSEKQLWVMSSKGCYGGCSFCLWVHTLYNNKVVYKEADTFIRQTEAQIKKYGPEYILFDDDAFNVHPKENAIEIANWLGTTGLPWSVMLSFDGKFDEETYRNFERNNCVGLRIGMESACQTALDTNCPGKTVDQQLSLIDFVMEETELPLFVSVQHDMLGETEEGRAATDALYEKLKPLYHSTGGRMNVQYPISMAFPGTPMAKMLEDKGLWFDGNPLEIPWSQFMDGSTVNAEVLEMNRAYNKMLKDEKNT